MEQKVSFDADLIRRYDYAGPRYTSYPTAVQFHEGFTEAEYRTHALATNDSGRPLSLYFHIPFCARLCFYCACNKVVTKNRAHALPYLQDLHREIAMQGELFSNDRRVDQLHWGGGTPTFLSHEQMTELMRVTARHFNLRDDDTGEYSIEVDPREADAETIVLLRGIGFNRISLGVQDLEERVQRAVNRLQPEEQTLAIMDAARAQGFKSINTDLIYGLPFQSVESFARTLDRVIEFGPDRLSVFNYAHMPHLFKPQRRIIETDLPTPAEKLEILQLTIERLTGAGYVYIGMDHFARPDDELARAQQEGRLYRNFQGYSTHAGCDLVAMGITSIGSVGNTYAQNVKTLEAYHERIDNGHLPVYRGVVLSADDVLRRNVITDLICHFYLDIRVIEEKYQITFNDYFSNGIGQLEAMQDDGLLTVDAQAIRVLPAGRLLIRNICMVFDSYLQGRPEKKSFSRVI
ncbi:MAG TPA: oxygen-independent coproporphyrinogen III oxidase [Gammaproteobacteria bacterium]|nr:oxygen-independent coproporphyrinogen III oxidase [Gammaproteobacteria bacterium]